MPNVTFLPTGTTYEAAAGKRYHDLCRELDIPHPFGCTVGSCGTCCSIVEKGGAELDPPSDDEKDTLSMCADHEPRARLACQILIRADLALRPIES